MQPVYTDKNGIERFKSNAIVTHLLENSDIDMNKLAVLDFTDEDRQQFAQLIGYSLDGYRMLSYVPDEECDIVVPDLSGLDATQHELEHGELAISVSSIVDENAPVADHNLLNKEM